jgi:hypothetical protein
MFPEFSLFLDWQPLLDIIDITETLLEASITVGDVIQGQLCNCCRGGGLELRQLYFDLPDNYEVIRS